jgi:hypothetical protein
MPETNASQPYYPHEIPASPAVTNHSRALRIAGAVTAVGLAAGTAAGVYKLSQPDLGPDQLATADDASHYIDQFQANSKSGDKNHDPAFRASTVEFLDDDHHLIGSAGLVRSGNTYQLATAEHVAGSITGKPEPGQIVAFGTPPKHPAFNIPGVGVFKLKGEATVIGPVQTERPEYTDRYATYTLTSSEQQAVAEAVDTGTLKVPEKVDFAGEFGDEFVMPLADSGKEVPFIYVFTDSDEIPTLVPLFVLNEQLDYEQGMNTLQAAMDAVRADFDSQNTANNTVEYTEETVMSVAIDNLQAKVYEKYKDDPKEAALNLPCMGDSGSPLLNSDGQIVGTLSRGSYFHQIGNSYQEQQDEAQDIARLETYETDQVKQVFTEGRYCLSTVKIATGK